MVENDRHKIVEILNDVRENHSFLTLVTDDGRVFSEILLISLSGNTMQIDKPLEWGDTPGPFRVFLHSLTGRCSFFKVSAATILPFTMTVNVPEELCVLQRRSSRRGSMPQGTVAVLRKDGRLLDSLYVCDLSPSGMLFCTSSHLAGIAVNTLCNDIVITIPAVNGRMGRTLPPIDQGTVVRSFREKDSHISFHAVAFDYESGYVREALRRVSWTRE